jgi:hypothetical protein
MSILHRLACVSQAQSTTKLRYKYSLRQISYKTNSRQLAEKSICL